MNFYDRLGAMKQTKTTSRPKNAKAFSFTTIDRYKLDTEWVDHVEMVAHYGRLLAKARLAYDQAKATTAIFEAETSRRVRSKPKNYSVTKLTEGAIKEAVTVELLYSKEHDNLLRAKHKVDILEAAMKTLEHRKKALSDLVFLHSQLYYSEPKMPKNNERMRSSIERNKDRQLHGIRDDDE
jgi:hypothetical protein